MVTENLGYACAGVGIGVRLANQKGGVSLTPRSAKTEG